MLFYIYSWPLRKFFASFTVDWYYEATYNL